MKHSEPTVCWKVMSVENWLVLTCQVSQSLQEPVDNGQSSSVRTFYCTFCFLSRCFRHQRMIFHVDYLIDYSLNCVCIMFLQIRVLRSFIYINCSSLEAILSDFRLPVPFFTAPHCTIGKFDCKNLRVAVGTSLLRGTQAEIHLGVLLLLPCVCTGVEILFAHE